ncbi:Uncharacterised protein [Corynebacterium renale]|uniref:YwiC-like family protein n=1 Tax=Corynebacterium renale TaxID=1724 RepID=UPI000DA42564|nr:YwiC-like family protein [Corynebacterium renale]SQG63435.1 Uncharacterised protein [Corynebacterium renale]STD00096.1 Uncharacterised protein [Corynebacterium renale]
MKGWVPNQHGAWAMLVTPAILGTVVVVAQGAVGWLWLAIMASWFFGYFTFFAFGLVARARTAARRRDYLPPVLVYGAVAFVAIIAALALRPELIWWACGFGPLVAIAVWETLRGRARSTLSGVATTIASALLLPVLMQVAGLPLGREAFQATFLLAAYFTGTVPYVKSMIRERRNDAYWRGSIAYHAVAAVMCAVLATSISGTIAMVWALWRAWYYPKQQRAGEKITPRQVGMRDVPLLLLCSAAVLLIVF